MSDQSDKPIAGERCGCYHDGRSTMAALQVALSFRDITEHMGLCDESRYYAMELCIVSLISNMILSTTAIDPGSQEARWETERIIKGLEARLMRHVNRSYEQMAVKGGYDQARFEDQYTKLAQSIFGPGIVDKLRRTQ